MNISFIVASNEREVLKNTFLASSDLHKEAEILVQIGKKSAAEAYNEGILKSIGDTLIFVHQDVYLPKGWLHAFKNNLIKLELIDSNWGVLGFFGLTRKGEEKGFVYSTGLKRYVGSPLLAPEEVQVLDELILVIRKNSGLFFDDKLPGFHLFGTDICLQAEEKGMRNYVLPCFAIHNSNGVKYLPKDFWKAYSYLRKKWKKKLPIITPCIQIFWPTYIEMINHFAFRFFQLKILNKKVGLRSENPTELFLQLNKKLTGP